MKDIIKLLKQDKSMIMGVLNVTPDSFSDGGNFFSKEQAINQANVMISQGANILDIGGESTRPNAKPVSLDEELDRVIPIIEFLSGEIDVPISIDTSKPKVMSAAIDAGANMINDVYALQNDGALEVAASLNVPVCLMHMQGSPLTMQNNPQYSNNDAVSDIVEFFKQRILACDKAGIDRSNIVVDPGFGFGKTLEHNVQLLKDLDKLHELGCPVLAGLSRKSMIGKLIGLDVQEREYASIALALIAVQNGADIVRVHDVKGTHDAIRIYESMYIN